MFIKIDISKLERRYRELIAKAGNPRTLMSQVALTILNDMEQHFDQEVDASGKKWEKLQPIGYRLRGIPVGDPVKLLQDTGRLRQLHFQLLDNKKARIGTSVNYGRLHNFGGLSHYDKIVNGQRLTGDLRAFPRQWAYLSERGKLKVSLTMKNYFSNVS